MRRTLVTILILALSTQVQAFAQERAEDAIDTDEPTAAESETEVETRVGSPMKAFDAARSENVVVEEEIRRRQATSVTDVLADEVGVTVQSTNRGAGTIFLRGLVGPENLIIFDGVRFNQSTFRTGPNQYLDTIDPWALQQINVVRGPGSVFHGSGAMGGVVLVEPKALPTDTMGTTRIRYDSADTSAAAMAEVGSSAGGFSGYAGGTYRTHGELRAGSNGEDFVLTGLQGTRFLARPYDEGFWRAAAGYEVGNHQLRGNYFGGLVNDAMRVDRLGSGEMRTYDNQDHLGYVTYSFDGPTAVDEFRVNLSWHRTVEDVHRVNCATEPISVVGAEESFERVASVSGCLNRDRGSLRRVRDNWDRVDTFGSSATGLSRLFDGKLAILWGGDVYTDAVRSEREDAREPDFDPVLTRGNFADGSTYNTVGVFGSGRYAAWSRGPHLLRTELGARVETFAASAPEVSETLGDVEYSFTGLVGSAGVAYLYDTALHAFLNWTQGFRAPNLQETTVLGDSGNFYEVPNPDLGPERSNTFELGAKVDLAGAVRVTPSVWASLLSNRITREPTTFEGASAIEGKEVRHRVNRDSAYFHGFDIAAETATWNHVSLYGNMSWIDGAVETSTEDPSFRPGPFHELMGSAELYGNPRRLPPFSYLAGLRAEPDDHWSVGFFVRGAGARTKLAPDDRLDERICEVAAGVLYEDLGQTCPGTSGWVTLNARAGYTRDAMTIDVSALNLTDRRYRPHGSGVPGPGISFAAQMTLQY